MKQILFNSLLVGGGGFLGSLARYGMTLLLQRHSLGMPLGTLASNLVGCFVIGCLAGLAAPTPFLTPGARLLLATGFCGGFTTLSSMMYEIAQFLRAGEFFHAGVYLTVTLAGSLALFFLGIAGVRIVVKSTGGLWN